MSELVTRIRESDSFCSLEAADEKQIIKAQNTLGLEFSDDFCEYLKAFGIATFANRELTGICSIDRLNVVNTTMRARQFFPLFPNNLYVIEELLIDHVVIAQDQHGYVYSYGPNDAKQEIAKSLYEYLFLQKE